MLKTTTTMAIAPVRLPMPLKPLSIIDISHVIHVCAYSTTRAQNYFSPNVTFSPQTRARAPSASMSPPPPSKRLRATNALAMPSTRPLTPSESLSHTEARRRARHPPLEVQPLPIIDPMRTGEVGALGRLDSELVLEPGYVNGASASASTAKAATHGKASGGGAVKLSQGSSAYVGVHRVRSRGRQRWRSMIAKTHLGYFDDEGDAADAVDRAHIVMYGEPKNFGEERYSNEDLAKWRSEDYGIEELLKEMPPPMGHLPGRRPRSNFKGVTCDNRAKKIKFKVELFHKGKQVSMGYFDDLREAARAYDMAALVSRGDNADTNFPFADYEHDGTIARLHTFNGDFERYRDTVVTRNRGPNGQKTSKYLGVRKFYHEHVGGNVTMKWRAELVVRHKRIDLGYFNTEEDAARAVDAARIENPPVRMKLLNFPAGYA